MRKLLILFILLALLPMTVSAGRRSSRTVPRARLNAIVSEFRHLDGVEAFHLGWFGTAAAKGAARIATASDPDSRQAMALLNGVKDFTVLDFSDCDDNLRDRISRRISRALDGCELLMEMHDDGTAVRLYGTLDDRSGKVRDVVLYDAADCALVYVLGNISMDAVGRLLAND